MDLDDFIEALEKYQDARDNYYTCRDGCAEDSDYWCSERKGDFGDARDNLKKQLDQYISRAIDKAIKRYTGALK